MGLELVLTLYKRQNLLPLFGIKLHFLSPSCSPVSISYYIAAALLVNPQFVLMYLLAIYKIAMLRW